MSFFRNVWAAIRGFFRLLNALLVALTRGISELEKVLIKVESDAREFRESESKRLEVEYQELLQDIEDRKVKRISDSSKPR